MEESCALATEADLLPNLKLTPSTKSLMGGAIYVVMVVSRNILCISPSNSKGKAGKVLSYHKFW